MSLKIAQYVYHLNTFHLLRTEGGIEKAAEGTSKKAIKKC